MRHAKKRHQLNRSTSWRKATLISILKNLLIYQSIRTTRGKAKAVKPLMDKLIASALKDTLAGKRQAFKILGDHKLVSLLFNDIAKRFSAKTGGYTRILNMGKRRGDNAEVVVFELTAIKKKERKDKSKKEKPGKPEVEKPLEKEEKLKTPEVKSPEEKARPPITQKPTKKFLGGLRNIFKKERRDSS